MLPNDLRDSYPMNKCPLHPPRPKTATQEATEPPCASFSNIPGPPTFDKVKFRVDNHHYITSLHEKYGDIIRVASQDEGRKWMVYVRNPSTVKHVLMSETMFDKTFADADNNSSSYLQYFKNLVQPLFANASIFGSNKNVVQPQRQNLKKAFSASPELLPGFKRAIERSLTLWPDTGTEKMDVVPVLHRMVFNAVMVCMAGDDVEVEESNTLFQACSECLVHFQGRYSKPLFDEQINDADEFWMRKVEMAGMDVMHVIQEKHTEETLSGLAEISLIGVMQQFGLSDAETNATMLNALFAACEAPVQILVSLLSELSQRPGTQEKLYSEVSAMEKTEEGIDNLYFDTSLLNDCVMESLRRFAPVTLVQRCTTQDTALDGFNVPKDTVVGICIAAVHANEQYFPEPTTFNPCRQGLDMVILNAENGFMPFSSGPRGCPGRYLAATIMKMCTACIVSKYKVKVCTGSTNVLPETTAVIHKFVEFPMTGIFVGLEPRQLDVARRSRL